MLQGGSINKGSSKEGHAPALLTSPYLLTRCRAIKVVDPGLRGEAEVATPATLPEHLDERRPTCSFESGKRLWLVRPLDSQRLLHRAFSLRRVLRLEGLAEQ